MDTQDVDAFVQDRFRTAPVLVTDLLAIASKAQIVTWVERAVERRRVGFLPVRYWRRWEETPVVILPLNGRMDWRRASGTLRGTELYARALAIRMRALISATG